MSLARLQGNAQATLRTQLAEKLDFAITLAERFEQFAEQTGGFSTETAWAFSKVLIAEGLVDEGFIASRTIGYDELRRNVEGYTPEAMAPICGIPAETLREAQQQPEKHRDLIVRVAGYSDYFTSLPAALQEEVIARTEFQGQA